MNVKSVFSYFIFTVIIITITVIITLNLNIINILRYISENKTKIMDYTGYLSAACTLLLFVKSKFYDSRIIRNLEKNYGKQKLVDSLEILINLLEIYDPKTVLEKVCIVSDIELHMKKAIIDLNNLMSNQEEKPTIELNKFEQRKLQKQINELLNLLDKKIEINQVDKKYKDEFIIDQLEKGIYNVKRNIKVFNKFNPNKDVEVKNKLVTNFNNKTK